MEPSAKQPKLITIVGPTASGKTELAINIAKLLSVEIIAADSRTIYKDLDIGTAKPTPDQLKSVKHYGINIIEPGQKFSAYEFKKLALRWIEEIQLKNKVPLMVGGTGLYIDSVLYDYKFTVPSSNERSKLEKKSIKMLQDTLTRKDLELPENKNNKLHLIRAIERGGMKGSRSSLRSGTLLIGILPTDDVLRKRINDRAQMIFSKGVVNEAKKLLKQYDKETIRNGGIVYSLAIDVLENLETEQTAATKFAVADWQYARRQKTWFKRNKDITWFDSPDKGLEYLKTLLNN